MVALWGGGAAAVRPEEGNRSCYNEWRTEARPEHARTAPQRRSGASVVLVAFRAMAMGRWVSWDAPRRECPSLNYARRRDLRIPRRETLAL